MSKVVSITVESGLSFPTKEDIWYKFKSSITVEVEEGDNLEEVKKKAWNTVHTEVEKQVTEILKVNGAKSLSDLGKVEECSTK